MRYSLLTFLLILIALPCSIRGEEEEPHGFPPFTSWDDVEDITDKVIAWDIPFAKVEKYSLLDPNIPDLPDPHPMCFAPPEYDSYEGGTRKYPKQCGYEKSGASMEDPRSLWSFSFLFQYSPHYTIFSFLNHIKHYDNLATNNMPIESKYETRAAEKALQDFSSEKGNMMSICISPRNFIFVKETKTNTWGIKIVDCAYFVSVTTDGKLSVKEIKSLKGYEYLACFRWEHNSVKTGATAFLNGNNIYVLSADGLSQPIPFTPIWQYNNNIWNPLSFFSGGKDRSEPIQAYPIIPFCEKNYGYPKGEEMPPITYNPTLEMDDYTKRHYWYDTAKIRPETYDSNIFLFDLSTGKTTLRLKGVHTLIQVDSNYVVMKNIAIAGKWHMTGIQDNTVIFNLPLSKIIPNDLRHIYCTDGRHFVAISPFWTVMVDFVEMRVVRFCHSNAIEEDGLRDYMQMMYLQHLYISKPFENNGVKCRRIWSVSRQTCNPSISFIIPDPYSNAKQRTPPIWLDSGLYLLYSGNKYLTIYRGKK